MENPPFTQLLPPPPLPAGDNGDDVMTTEKHHLVDPGETVGPGIHVECGGCRRHIDQASGGVVVAFG